MFVNRFYGPVCAYQIGVEGHTDYSSSTVIVF
jgi:hypothetical protein